VKASRQFDPHSSENSIKARCIVESRRTLVGEILFTSQPIAFLQGVDPEKGMVSDRKHELFGKAFAGKILVFPNAVGSSVGAYVIYRLAKNHVAPKAMINQNSDIITASGCAISGIPLFDLLGSSLETLKGTKRLEIDSRNSIRALGSS
jgi:predicted aconitase with swiveling domain